MTTAVARPPHDAPTSPVPERVGRFTAGTTPARYRLWSVAVALALGLTAVLAVAAASNMRSATHRAADNSGPVLVANQQLISSLAEADAAATAAFLSGRNEDPEQRRLYEQAIARAGEQVSDVASLSGNDPAIRTILSRISFQVTQYAGLVEAARASNKSGAPDAAAYLTSAVRAANQTVQGDVAELTKQAQSTLQDDTKQRSAGVVVAVVAFLLALALLVVFQGRLYRNTRRVINLPLALATVLTLVAMVWLLNANSGSGGDLADARKQGYDSIVVTTDLSTAGFGAKAAETLFVITGDPAQRDVAQSDARRVAEVPVTPEVTAAIRNGTPGGPGGLLGAAQDKADSPRERAAVAEAAVRWERYQNSVAALRTAANATAARAIAVGPANADFNGFNFSVEAILGQNRAQFLDGLDSAAGATSRLPTAMVLLLLVAIGAALWGFQLRINEYR